MTLRSVASGTFGNSAKKLLDLKLRRFLQPLHRQKNLNVEIVTCPCLSVRTVRTDSNLISSKAKKAITTTTTNTQHIRSHSLHKKLSISGGGGRSMISLSLHCHCQFHSLSRLVSKRDISPCLNVMKKRIFCIQ